MKASPHYLLDTDICSYLIRKKSPTLLKQFQKHQPTDFALSSITVMELFYGCERMEEVSQWKKRIESFIAPFPILAYHRKESEATARIRAELERKGKPIGAYDLLIAGSAMAQGLTLLTNNLREYSRIKGLLCEKWV